MAIEPGLMVIIITILMVGIVIYYKTSNKYVSIETVYNDFLGDHPLFATLGPKLASGGIVDTKGVNTSDVDISVLVETLDDISHVFTTRPSVIKDDRKKPRQIYEFSGYSRPVNVFVTTDPALANRSVIHRTNELMLAREFKELYNMARSLKTQGFGTEAAWCFVLNISGDPYEKLLVSEDELRKQATVALTAWQTE